MGFLCISALVVPSAPTHAVADAVITSITVAGPPGSAAFGTHTLVLSNGNYVVTDPSFSNGSGTQVGAVWLYDGRTNAVISTLTGRSPQDQVGYSGVFEVGPSNFVVNSPFWSNGGNSGVGAVTWVDGTTGLNAMVTPSNSFIGLQHSDSIGEQAPVVLANGNYVASTSGNLGAVTWGSGSAPLIGVVSAANSLVGSPSGTLYSPVVTPLSNGNYVVASSSFAGYRGSATWGNGLSGTVGQVSSANSLVGGSSNDGVDMTVTALANGNYVVAQPNWDRPGQGIDAGAVTWASGVTAKSGVIDASNSLVGKTAADKVGTEVIALSNSNYVVRSPSWDYTIIDLGAVTWASGATGLTGDVSVSNSLYGLTANDSIGSGGVFALANGNYVVASGNWHAAGAVGAVTWRSGSASNPINVSVSNSMIGTRAADFTGVGVWPLTNGNFVVAAPSWDLAALTTDVGAVRLGNGTTGVETGVLTTSNSLTGSTTNDRVGFVVTPLANGNFVVLSSGWANGAALNAGASTWVSGTTGRTGPVTAANSSVGTRSGDGVGIVATALTNGNYIVGRPNWSTATAINVGAVQFGNGSSGGVVGPLSASNSLIGSTTNDRVGYDQGFAPLTPGFALSDGSYIVNTRFWHKAGGDFVGAATWGDGLTGIAGVVGPANSLVGRTLNDQVGQPGNLTDLGGGRYLIFTEQYVGDAPSIMGAYTYGEAGGIHGQLTTSNSVFGFGLATSVAPRLTGGNAAILRTATKNRITLILLPDRTNPVIAAHANVVAATVPGGSGSVVTYDPPAATDERSIPVVVCTPASGSTFPVGVTTVTCVATDSAGNTASSSFTVTINARVDYVPLPPARLADSRADGVTVDGSNARGGRLADGATLQLQVAGRGGVAADARAAALNVTAVDPTVAGFVTVYPCDEARPTASNLNYTPGSVVPNAALAKLSASGTICLFTSQPTDLVVDVNGFTPASTSYQPINPARVLDTRKGTNTVDGLQQGGGIVAADSITTLPITGRAGIPANAAAVTLNVTVTEPVAAGYVTVYPCGVPAPTASNLNVIAGATVANLVVSNIGTAGNVCIYSQASTHLVVDVDGYFPADSSYDALVPARLLDTRPGSPTIDGASAGTGLLAPGTVTILPVLGRGGLPLGASTVVLNVTVTEPVTPGFVTVYPCGIAPPLASNLNFVAGQTVANAVFVKVGAGGSVCLFNSQGTQLIADVEGYFPP